MTTTTGDDDPTEFVSPTDAARMFGVQSQTLARWTDEGRLECIRTAGGHRRYRRTDLETLLAASQR